MKLEFDFLPDAIYYFIRDSSGHILKSEWGDQTIYPVASSYIQSLVKDYGYCMLAIQKGTLKYKVFEVSINS